MAESIIHFVGQEFSYGVSSALKGVACWYFVQPVSRGVITVEATVVVLRRHPLHEESLASAAGVLLIGKVRALSGVKDSDTSYIVDDQLSG